MDAQTDKIVTGGADSTINIWRDTTQETKEAELEIQAAKV